MPKKIWPLALLFVFLSGCVAADQPVSSNSCGQIVLEKAEGYPSELIQITGLPENVEDIYAEVEASGFDAPFSAMIVVENESAYHLVVPVHPEGISGGTVNVRIMDGEEPLCESIDLKILPLQAADGAFRQYVHDLQEYFQTVMQSYNIDRETLLYGDLNELPAYYVPFAAAQYLLDSPENPNSLEKILSGTASSYQEEDIDLEVLDALTAHLGLTDLAEEMALEESMKVLAHNQDVLFASAAAIPPQIPSLIPSADYVGSVGELSDLMQEQQECMNRLTGATGKLLNDADLASGAVGLVNGVAGNAFGIALLVHKFPTEACAYLNPSKLTGMRVDVWKGEFEEDYAGEPGEIISVWATPVSEGWNITGVMIDIAFLAAGGVDSAADSAKLGNSGVGTIVGKNVPSDAVQTANATLGPMVNNLCDRLDGCADDKPAFFLDNNPWNEVNIWGEEWVDVEYKGSAIKPAEAFGSFEPNEVGTGTLDVWTKSDVFGNTLYKGSKNIIVHAIEVKISPDGASMKTGQTICFNGTVRNAVDTGLRWFLRDPDSDFKDQGVTDDPLDQIDDYCFTAPDFPLKPKPDQCEAPDSETKHWALKAVSLADQGLRARATEDREHTVFIAVTKDPKDWIPPEECRDPNKCLLGTWELDNESYKAFLKEAEADADSEGEISEISGSMYLTFSDDNTVTQSSENFAVKVCTNAGCINIAVQQSGTTDYSTYENLLTMSSGGFLTTATAMGQSGETGSEGGRAEFTCTTKTLLIDAFGLGKDLPPLLWHRVK